MSFSLDVVSNSMNSIVPYIPLLVQGILVTSAAWLVTAVMSLSLGIVIGIISCRQLASPWLTRLVRVYTFIAKGIPAYVHILIAYFVLPSLLGISISGFVAACLALGFCSSGYVTEIVRAGINSIGKGQWDACGVLGYPLWDTLSRVIMPQTMRNILPALGGELEQLLKSTSLLATIGVMELTRSGMNIISRELNPFPVYMTVACIYLFFSGLLQLVMMMIEKRGCYGYRS